MSPPRLSLRVLRCPPRGANFPRGRPVGKLPARLDTASYTRRHALKPGCRPWGNYVILAASQLPNTSVSDIPPSRSFRPQEARSQDKRGFLQKLAEMLHPGPDSKDELIETLVEAEDNEVIGAQSREMLEGVIRMADMTAGDVMVAAPRMDVINIDAPFDELLH